MERSAIHDFTLDARELLMSEARDLLEGVYGLGAKAVFEPAEKLPALAQLPEAAETRRRLESFFADEAKAGLKGAEAVDKLVKEVAFTHLNRLVAFKMLEARKLARGVIDKGHDSNEFKLYLADDEHADDLERFKQGTLPPNALREGPRDVAYRRFLLWQCDRLAREIRVLFDAGNLPSRLFPRPRALKAALDAINSPELAEAWRAGNEETIGWVYQSFNSEDLEAAFREVRLSGKKFEAEDIPAVTQLFTPRWIVRFLVENTLGRYWASMHPDSRLLDGWGYLVPEGGEPRRVALEPASRITLIDPACGTMHFGLAAFDLFAAMYREERERAGDPGWPSEPSVQTDEEIPAAILANNLFGVDIDLRAVQLSALALHLRAKTLAPTVRLTDSNLACADIRIPDGDRLDGFIQEAFPDQPIYKRILQALEERLRDAVQLGSLLRVEREIQSLVEEERRRYEADRRAPDLFGWSAEQFETAAGREEFWEVLEAQILQGLEHYAREHGGDGFDQAFFVGETSKGLRLFDVLARRYDAVVTNPPYMSARKMNARLKKLVAAEYPKAKGDLYAAFTQRCAELANESGLVGMLTMHSFMFISSYEGHRENLLGNATVSTAAHLGPALFDVGNPGTLQTAAYVLRREGDEASRDEAVGTYFRLVKEPDAEAKRAGFEQALARLKGDEDDPRVFRCRQGDFRAIPGAPWVYWITPGLRRLFRDLPKLGEIAKPRHGLSTCNNFRYLRFWWEVGLDRIAFGCRNAEEAQTIGMRWFPYMKGGSFQRWYGNQEYVVNWQDDGNEIKSDIVERFPYLKGNFGLVVTNPDFYFRRGVTWTDLTTGRFSARLSPGGFLFDVSGSSTFPDDIEMTLGVMCSAFAQHTLKLINPTVHVQVGDLARLPYPEARSESVRKIARRAIDLARKRSAEDEGTYDFTTPLSRESGLEEVQRRHRELADLEARLDEEVFDLYSVSAQDRSAIEDEAGNSNDAESTSRDSSSREEHEAQTMEALAGDWIAYALGIVLGRFKPGCERHLGCGVFSPDIARTLGGLADEDGVLVLDADHSDDLATRTLSALSLMLGETAAEEVITTICGGRGPLDDRLRKWLAGIFWKDHLQRYRKRPPYWLLQSPKKGYSVYLFHERATRDTLPLIRGTRYLAGKINDTKRRIRDLDGKLPQMQGVEATRLRKERDALDDLLTDLEAFDRNLEVAIHAQNERGETVGWAPEIDDGIILNMAPLHELFPSWKAEPLKYWKALENGDYDWSRTALRYWPDRVAAACRKNKSYSIALGLPYGGKG